MLRERLYAPITITENGRRKKVTVLEALYRQTVKNAFAGDHRAQERLFRMVSQVDAAIERELSGDREESAQASPDDQAVLEAFAKMLGSSLDHLSSDVEGPADE